MAILARLSLSVYAEQFVLKGAQLFPLWMDVPHRPTRDEQQAAVTALLPHELGVLAATTAFGKTVIAARLIAERKVNTLVLVHRQQLLDQWIERLTTFLDIDRKQIGHIGGGKHKPTGIIDVALIQSLCRKGVVDERPAIQDIYAAMVTDTERNHLLLGDVMQAMTAGRSPVMLIKLSMAVFVVVMRIIAMPMLIAIPWLFLLLTTFRWDTRGIE